jgi:AcrR family transcriptional regulator
VTTSPKVTRRAATPRGAGQLAARPRSLRRQPAEELGPRANRTIAAILDATREVFLTHGYAGTTIDEIARAAGISRASFYTYFPTKRDVLLGVGAHSVREVTASVNEIAKLEPSLAALTEWVDRFFDLMEIHGPFAFAWTQAARHDEEIREAGTKGHTLLCGRFGKVLGAMGGITIDDPVALGLASFSMLERAWDYCRLYGTDVDQKEVRAAIARTLWASTRLVAAEDSAKGAKGKG